MKQLHIIKFIQTVKDGRRIREQNESKVRITRKQRTAVLQVTSGFRDGCRRLNLTKQLIF